LLKQKKKEKDRIQLILIID